MSDLPQQNNYTARYYAHYDPQATQTTPVTGWYDMQALSSLDDLPPLSELLPLTAEQWDERLPFGQGVLNRQIVPYTPPPPPLKERAQTALNSIMAQAPQITAMGEVFGTNTRACVQKLRAIIDGTDTTSTELPTVPSDLTT